MGRAKNIVVLLSAVAASAVVGSPEASAAADIRQFKNDFSHLCMNVTSGAMTNGARIEQWDCTPTNTAKQWKLEPTSIIDTVQYYMLRNVRSDRCLDVPNGSLNAGVELQQWDCWTGRMQQWALVPAGTSVTIRNLNSGLCVDDKNWGGAGAALQQWNCTGQAVQTWRPPS